MNDAPLRRPRVLVGAYAFGPSDEPEASAGWAFATAAAVDHDVWVLCRRRFVTEIAAELEKDPKLADHLHVVHIDLSDRVRRFYRHSWDMYWYYALWQRIARRVAKRMHREIGFDVAHHVTFANDWLPSGVAGLEDVPFVWGPVGGATRIPVWRLRRWLGVEGVRYEITRSLVTTLPRLIWGDRNARAAAVVAAQNGDVAHRFRRARRVVIEPNASLDPSSLPERVEREPTAAPHAVFVGRLIPLKGGSLALAALALPTAQDWSATFYGDGPERAALERIVRERGLEERVRFVGHRPRREVLEAMASADILLFPSMHDQAGWAAAEASSIGIPVVCLPLGGPPTLAEPNAFVAELTGDLAANVAAAMNRARATGGTPHQRWSPQRLPGRVTEWYRDAMEGS